MTGRVDVNPGVNRVRIPDNAFGNLGDAVGRRRPFQYVFRAWGGYRDLNNNEFEDSTPANIRFVVVEDVQTYIQNRPSQDNLPIKEVDRPSTCQPSLYRV